MKNRSHILSLALALAGLTLYSALLLTWQRQSLLRAQVPVWQQAAVSLPQDEESAASPWMLQSVDGEICILREGEIVLHTGVSVALLPQQDRQALETGIPAEDEQALTALLEDLSS
ncbi:MAG: hypothetical protein LUH16_01480 [Clostridiales bacterium]|nr:hypothetical protein [Clostridiales bacterium]